MSPSVPKSRIYIIDDDPTHRELLHHILTGAGYAPETFPGGVEALAALPRHPPDLILLDVDMPGMDGYEVCARIKESSATAAIPVLFISILDEPDSKIRGFHSGGVDYIPKPFHLEEVLARVGTHLRLSAYHSKLEAKNKKLRETELLRDNLTGMLIHDLRSPLAGLAASLDLLGHDPASGWSEQDRAVLRAAQRTSVKLVEMVTSLLDVSRFEVGQMPLNPGECDLREVAESAISSVIGLAGSRRLQKTFPPHPSPVYCDSEIIRRVITNLLANAYKFTPDHSDVQLRIEIDSGEVKLSVKDHGPGIPEEYHNRIFEKFGQVQTRTACYSTGLGLTFCKLAVEAHQGKIGVVSTEGAGSTFWFSLPAQPR